jgi:ATP-binding protein involved in chromosome partitioning
MRKTAMTARTDVENALKGYVDPYLEQDLVTAKCVNRFEPRDGRIEVDVELGFPAAGYRETLIAALRDRLISLPGAGESRFA